MIILIPVSILLIVYIAYAILRFTRRQPQFMERLQTPDDGKEPVKISFRQR